jgi:hypothetical protein
MYTTFLNGALNYDVYMYPTEWSMVGPKKSTNFVT